MIWIDAQLSPSLAPWITETFGYEAYSVKYLALRNAPDEVIFAEACKAGAIVVTKDIDFVHLLDRHGSPPKVIWLTCGNTSNKYIRTIFQQHLPIALKLLETSDLIEITSTMSGK